MLRRLVEAFSSPRDREALAYTLGGVFSLVGLVLVFSELGRGEAMWFRAVTIWCFFLGAGFLMGFLNPRRWLLAALLPAAWCFVFTIYLAGWGLRATPVSTIPLVLGLWTLPIALVVIAGAIGRRYSARWPSLSDNLL
jgi:hypothetical protein